MGFFPHPSPLPPPRVSAGIRLDVAFHPDEDKAPPENQKIK